MQLHFVVSEPGGGADKGAHGGAWDHKSVRIPAKDGGGRLYRSSGYERDPGNDAAPSHLLQQPQSVCKGARTKSGNVYAADIDDLRTRLNELWEAADGSCAGLQISRKSPFCPADFSFSGTVECD